MLIVEIVIVVLRYGLDEPAGRQRLAGVVQREAHLVSALTGGHQHRAAVLTGPRAAVDVQVGHQRRILDQILKSIGGIGLVVIAVVAVTGITAAGGQHKAQHQCQ